MKVVCMYVVVQRSDSPEPIQPKGTTRYISLYWISREQRQDHDPWYTNKCLHMPQGGATE